MGRFVGRRDVDETTDALVAGRANQIVVAPILFVREVVAPAREAGRSCREDGIDSLASALEAVRVAKVAEGQLHVARRETSIVGSRPNQGPNGSFLGL